MFPSGPAGLIIEATKAAALIWQAWEMHQQTLMQHAQDEERRIPWLGEILFQWSAEIQGGQLRLDTATHFDREISRLLEKLVESKMMDLPSLLLLQVERCARGMSALNQLLADRLREEKLLNPELPELIDYRPFWEVDTDDLSIESYLGQVDRTLVLVEKSFIGTVKSAFRSAVWHFSAWKAAKATATKKERLDEFASLTAVARTKESQSSTLVHGYFARKGILYSVR